MLAHQLLQLPSQALPALRLVLYKPSTHLDSGVAKHLLQVRQTQPIALGVTRSPFLGAQHLCQPLGKLRDLMRMRFAQLTAPHLKLALSG